MRRNAALIVAISLLSGFGGTAMSVVAGVWTLDLTGSSRLAALTGLCVYAPQLAGPWLGGLLDQAPRRPLVVGVNLGLAAVLLSLFAVRTAGQVWLIFVVSFAYGASYVLLDAGETALLPDVLRPDDLADVNGWRSSALEGTKLVAPLAGTGLYAWHGGHAVTVLSAAAPVLAAALYPALRLLPASQRSSEPSRKDGLRGGLAVLWGTRTMRVTVGLTAVAIAMTGFQTTATYSLVTTVLGLPASFLGVVVSVQGAGSIFSGLVFGRLLTRWGPIAVASGGTILYGAGCLVRCLPWWPATLTSALVVGVGLPLPLIAALTVVQTETPAALRGRVAATVNTVTFGPLALAIPLGAAAVALGVRPVLVISAVTCLAAVACLRFGSKKDAKRRWHAPKASSINRGGG